MTPQRLADALETLADGPPWDTAWLQSLLPELAVRGRLVGQDAATPVANRIRDLVEVIGGSTPSKDRPDYWGGDMPWVSPKDMKVWLIEDSEDHITPFALSDRSQRVVPTGAVLVVIRGMILAHSFPVAINTREVTINQDMKAIVPTGDIAPGWLAIALRGMKRVVLERVERSTHGTCKLAIGQVLDLPIPVPPLPEQHRIVAKVDELMGHAAVLEERHLAASSARVRLRDAALHALAEAEDAAAVEQAWQRIEEHFEDLFTEPEDIQPLRQTILQLAVRGRLVRQEEDERDTPDRGTVRADGIPTSWKLYDLGSLLCAVQYGFTAKANPESTGPRFLRITDIQDDRVNWDLVPGCEIDHEDLRKLRLQDGDIVVARTGGTVGKSYLVSGLGSRDAVFASYLIRLTPRPSLDPQYLKYFMGSPMYWEQIGGAARGAAQPNVNSKQLRSIEFPLPPLAEQHRIVAKVDELMALCDTLESSLERAKTTRERFAASISAALSADPTDSPDRDAA